VHVKHNEFAAQSVRSQVRNVDIQVGDYMGVAASKAEVEKNDS